MSDNKDGKKKGLDDVHDFHIPSDELGKRLGGGIPKGSIVLIEGEEGSGRSVLSQRFCFGLLTNGAQVTFVNTEQTMKQFIDQMYSLSYRIDRHLIAGQLQFFPVYPLLGSQAVRRGFMDKLMGSPVLYDKEVLIVDSLSSLIGDELSGANCLKLMGFLKKQARLDKTIILTVEKGLPALEPLRLGSDIYLSLNTKHSGGGLLKTVEVKRFLRARGNVDDVLSYRVEPRSGLVIEITEVAG
jgi:flagellar protein FlaH